MTTKFTEWLLQEMEWRDLSMRELARRSHGGVSHTQISKVLSGQADASADFCIAIAKAMRLPEIDVLRRAGHINTAPGETERLTLRELWTTLRGMSDDQLREVRHYARFLASGAHSTVPPAPATTSQIEGDPEPEPSEP
jgi:transcriptional regulator with XRE-family HTH domain